MHECIRRKVNLTYSSDKSRKSSILYIRFIENADLATFSKDFLLSNNRKQTMRIKRVCPKLSDLEIWYEVSPCRSKLTDQVSLETYLPEIKVKRYRTYRADRYCLNTQQLLVLRIYFTFKFVNDTCAYYLKEVFEFGRYCRTDTRNKFGKLKIPFRKTNIGQKGISFVGPSL